MSHWKPVYLRAVDKAAMISALSTAGLLQQDPESDEEVIGGDPFKIRVRVLGPLYEPTGATLTDAEGSPYPEMAQVPGWHVNVFVHPDHETVYRQALSEVLVDPEPVTPIVRWMGS